jgi:hypothetical protein
MNTHYVSPPQEWLYSSEGGVTRYRVKKFGKQFSIVHFKWRHQLYEFAELSNDEVDVVSSGDLFLSFPMVIAMSFVNPSIAFKEFRALLRMSQDFNIANIAHMTDTMDALLEEAFKGL